MWYGVSFLYNEFSICVAKSSHYDLSTQHDVCYFWKIVAYILDSEEGRDMICPIDEVFDLRSDTTISIPKIPSLNHGDFVTSWIIQSPQKETLMEQLFYLGWLAIALC